MARDPLYEMEPTHPEWMVTLTEEAEDLVTALYQDDDERFRRKAKEIHHALSKMGFGD